MIKNSIAQSSKRALFRNLTTKSSQLSISLARGAYSSFSAAKSSNIASQLAAAKYPGLIRLYSSATKKEVKLTAETYPSLQRDSRYAKLTKEDVEHFKTIVPENAILWDQTNDVDDFEPFNQDWMRKYKGQTQLVLKPSTTEQVSAILKHCNARKLAVVPQGGNTGLVGGSVPVFDEIVISLANMNKIISFDDVSGILVAEAGVILETADTYARNKGFVFPLDLGAKGSCHIGGNVATNAGGLRLLRYGSLHGTVLGLEAVLADGTVVNNLSKLRKDNTGYDLKQLFIGSEGTLGIVTKISILCPPKPTAVNVAFLGLESFEQVQKTFVKAKKDLNEILSAFECMDNTTQDMVENHTDLTRPLSEKYPFYVLIETSGSDKQHDDEKLERFLESALGGEEGSEPLILDGVVAQDNSEVANLWAWRELIPEALSKTGGVYKYDVTIPLPKLYDLVVDIQARLEEAGVVSLEDESKPAVTAAGYGHIGDGNLHLNVAVRRYDKSVESVMEPFVYEWVQKVEGSISAEHGLGLQKKNYIQYSKDQGMIELMKRTKDQFDPNHILNPYKYI